MFHAFLSCDNFLGSLLSLCLGAIDLYHTHKVALELGRLTEDLISPYILQEVHAVHEGYDFISHIEWYYQYFTVEPVWQSGLNLVYNVFPLLNKQTYLLYNVYTYPHPIPDSSYSIQVELEKHYWFDTMTGGLLY